MPFHISHPLRNTHAHFGVGKVTFFLFHILQFAKLRHTACYFDIFISYNMISIRTIFIPFHYYRTGLLTIFMILCIRSLWFIYYSLQVSTLKHHQSYPPPPAPGNVRDGTKLVLYSSKSCPYYFS